MFAWILFGLLLLFIASDIHKARKRGFFPAIFRLLVVLLCAIFAFVFAPMVSNLLMGLPLFGGETLGEAYEGYILSHGNMGDALGMSSTIKVLILGLPKALLAEIAFVLLFFIFRLIAWPITAVASRHLFKFLATRKRKKSGKPLLPAIKPNFAMLIGLLQALVCFTVLMVPVYGFVEFGETFTAEFKDTGVSNLEEISDDLQEGIVDPINNSVVGKIGKVIGQRKICIGVFHKLSTVTLEFEDGERKVDYFKSVEDMFPAVAAACRLADVNPQSMTDEDYNNLSKIFSTVQEHPEMKSALQSAVSNAVSTVVEENYKESADVLLSVFTQKLVDSSNPITGEKLKTEVTAMQNTIDVIQKAASGDSTNNVFEKQEDVDAFVSSVSGTDQVYDSLIEISNDPEKSATMRGNFNATSEKKTNMQNDIVKYRQDKLGSADYDRILSITDAVARVLDLDLTPAN